jgi:pimeloyl-ACP methyl ester carboxylesterase
VQTFSFLSADGTKLRGWRTGASGPPVVLSNGLGAPAEAWPGLCDADSGFDVVGWHHRGLGGSERPTDPTRIQVEQHAEDLRALMDTVGWPRALVVGWSIGVNVGFEVALGSPERVAGVLAVAGVPGGTFRALFGPTPLPRRWRPAAGLLAARALAHVGPAVRLVAGLLPPPATWGPDHGLGGSARRYAEASASALQAFAAHDWRWYADLVRAAEKHPPMDLSGLTCPVTMVGGSLDLLTSDEDMRRASRLVPDARSLTLVGSHYLPLEHPEVLLRELRRLADRATGP